MNSSEFNSARVRDLNRKVFNEKGKYILYWMQSSRRFHYNHSLDFAVLLSEKSGRPLVIYEGIGSSYPWNSERIHRFILEGMAENRNFAEKKGIAYWSFAESKENSGIGILKKISEDAYAVITDDNPSYIFPGQTSKLAEKIKTPLFAVDSNGMIPLKDYGEPVSAARILRPRIHRLFAESYVNRAVQEQNWKKIQFLKEKAPFKEFGGENSEIERILSDISFSCSVSPVSSVHGGRKAGLLKLKHFIMKKMSHYSDRSNPNPPELSFSSGLSAYIHFGILSVDEITEAVLNSAADGKWSPDFLNPGNRFNKENFFHSSGKADPFLDELLTWRDVGFLLFYGKPEFRKDLNVLPDWAKKNMENHRKDKREFIYRKDRWESADTHDELWNAGMKELIITGTMHNYMRMYWGKKLIEWSASFEEAFDIMEHLNNLYAYDGRDPNSYTGILWCFGLFDRPWFPERNVLGNFRYMSGPSMRKKFKMDAYLAYIKNMDRDNGGLFG